MTLYGIKFRLATTGGTPGAPFDATIANITINLSTAATDLASASLTFADNVGADNTTVFDGALHLTSTSPTKTSGVQPFDVLIQFENPFVYDPTKGDLLLDVFNFSGGETGLFDYITGGSDVLTRVVGPQGNVNATTAFFQQRAGLVTAFAINESAILGYHDDSRYNGPVLMDRDKIIDLCGRQMDEYDVYYCPAEMSGPTVLARYGNKGWEYSSTALFDNVLAYFEKHPESGMARAYQLIKEKGLA